jgi:3-phosphoshikimate 1-carboxyvinyltransferase
LGTLRVKETDRLAALQTELARLGAGASVEGDSLVIVPADLHAADITTYDDHRMAMSFALAGLRIDGVVITDPDCVTKTWPGYFEALEAMCLP